MIEPSEPPHLHKSHAHEPGSSRGGNGFHRLFETFTTLVLVLISACSLYTAFHTSETMEKLVKENARLVRAQSTPLLDYGTGNAIDEKSKIAALLVNGGSGPARIVWSRFTLDGKSYPTFEDAAASAIAGLAREPALTSSIDGTILRVGEQRRLFQLRRGDAPESVTAWRELDAVRGRISADICYCSFFEECWRARFNPPDPGAPYASAPEPVASCAAAAPQSPASKT